MSESIYIKSPREIEIMRQAAKIAAGARSAGREAIRAGCTTRQIDKAVHDYIVKNGATPSCLGYEGFPAATCVSVNDEVIHGIPGKRVVKDGDIVSIDLCATYRGFVGDCAGTYPVGEISEEARNLIEVTRQAFFEGLKFAKVDWFLSGWNATYGEVIAQADEQEQILYGDIDLSEVDRVRSQLPTFLKLRDDLYPVNNG